MTGDEPLWPGGPRCLDLLPLKTRITALCLNRSAMRNKRLRWLSRFSQCTRIDHVLEGGRPLVQKGGPNSYEAPPFLYFQTALSSLSPEAYYRGSALTQTG